MPGAYYLNRHAYDVTLVDTRVQTWEYKGGYTRRIIDLAIDQQGNLKQTERTLRRTGAVRPPSTARCSIKVEGWDIPQELRVVAQVAARKCTDRGGLGRRHPGNRASHPDAAHPLDRAQCRGLEYPLADQREGDQIVRL